MTASDGNARFYDHLKVVYKRRWPALTVFLLFAIYVCIDTFTTTPLFQGVVQVLIEKESSNIVTFKEAIEQNQTTDDYYQTQYRILQSRALARRTLDSARLWDHPALNPPPDDSLTVRKVAGMPVDFLRGWMGSRSAGASQGPLAGETRRSALIDRFLAGLSVAPIPRSRLVNVRYTSPDAAFAALAANAHANAFIDQNLEYRFLSSKEASDWLGERLTEQRQLVDDSERALQDYRERNDAIALDNRQDIVVQRLADLNAAVTRAKTERIEKEALYRQLRSLQASPASLDTFPAILANSFIQQQKADLAALQRQLSEIGQRLGDNHPDIVKLRSSIELARSKLEAEIGKVVQSVRNQFLSAEQQERSLTSALNQQKSEALAMNRKGIAYGVLEREAASNRQIFESLMQRTKETGISGELRTNNIRVIDAAEKPGAAGNVNVGKGLLLALLGGLGLGFGVAFLFEYLDNRIAHPDEITQHLGLAYLGMIPALFDKSGKAPLITDGAPPNFLESLRELRTNLLFSSAAEQAGRLMVVTSTAPGEGKTAVATNLAAALAQAGARVLLIDGDMRKPGVHTVFGQPQQPGLSNILVGEAKASESVRRTAVCGLWIMTAGTLPPNPPELLGSKRFRDFTASSSQHFDWVIVDTPPVMAVTDASIVARLASGVVFVVGCQLADRHAARKAVDRLRTARATMIGGVLNRVDLQHHPYYYSHYYRREYADYYRAGVAQANADKAAALS